MSNGVIAGDTVFLMSRAAKARLTASAQMSGTNYRKYFRTKAAQLIHLADPKFDVSGDALAVRVGVSLPPHVVEGLIELCQDFGVPAETAGELVACAMIRPAVNT